LPKVVFGYNKGEVGKTLNLGLGALNLFEYSSGVDNFIFGINAFYDLKNAEKGLFSSPHKRFSLGLEFKDSMGDIYGNIYRRQSGFINDERVLNGYDFVFSAQIPSIPNSKFNINRYDFSSNVVKKSGTKLRAEYFLTPYISFGGEYDKSNQNNSSKKLFVNFTYNFGEKLSQQVNIAKANTTQIWDKRYDEVIRENKVYLEKKPVTNLIAPPNLVGEVGESSVNAPLGSALGALIDESTGVVDLSNAVKTSNKDSEKVYLEKKPVTNLIAPPNLVGEVGESSVNAPLGSALGALIDESTGVVDLSNAVKTSNKDSETEFIDDFALKRIDGLTSWANVLKLLKLDGSNVVDYDNLKMGDLTYTITEGSTYRPFSHLIGSHLNPGLITIRAAPAGGTKYKANTFTYNINYF